MFFSTLWVCYCSRWIRWWFGWREHSNKSENFSQSWSAIIMCTKFGTSPSKKKRIKQRDWRKKHSTKWLVSHYHGIVDGFYLFIGASLFISAPFFPLHFVCVCDPADIVSRVSTWIEHRKVQIKWRRNATTGKLNSIKWTRKKNTKSWILPPTRVK